MNTRRIVNSMCTAIYIIAFVLFIGFANNELCKQYAFFFLLCVIAIRLGLVYEVLEEA